MKLFFNALMIPMFRVIICFSIDGAVNLESSWNFRTTFRYFILFCNGTQVLKLSFSGLRIQHLSLHLLGCPRIFFVVCLPTKREEVYGITRVKGKYITRVRHVSSAAPPPTPSPLQRSNSGVFYCVNICSFTNISNEFWI